MWAAGVILYHACTLEYPFNDNNLLKLSKKIEKGEYDETPLMDYSENMRKLIRALFNKDPDLRPSAQ